MAKSNPKKNKKHFKLRNAPRPPRAPTDNGSPTSAEPPKLTHGEALAYTIGGALVTAGGCALLSRYLVPGVLSAGIATAVGGTAVAIAKDPRTRAVGQGVLAAGGSQVLLVAVDNHYQENARPPTTVAKKPANAPAPPDDALISAFERARHRVALLEANQRAA